MSIGENRIKNIFVLIILAFLFTGLMGCTPVLKRDKDGIKGHTENVQDEFKNSHLSIHIPVEEQVQMSLPSEKLLAKKLPPDDKWRPNVIGYSGNVGLASEIYALPSSFLHGKDGWGWDLNRYYSRSTIINLRYDLGNISWKSRFVQPIEIDLGFPDSKEYAEMGIMVDLKVSPARLHIVCSWQNKCVVKDDSGNIVNQIKVTGSITVDEQKLRIARNRKIKELTKIYREEQRQEEERERERERKIRRLKKRAHSDETISCLATLRAMNNREVDSERRQAALNLFNKRDCARRIAELDFVENILPHHPDWTM